VNALYSASRLFSNAARAISAARSCFGRPPGFGQCPGCRFHAAMRVASSCFNFGLTGGVLSRDESPLSLALTLHNFRWRSPAFVQLLRRYYAAVRLPATVHVGLIAHRLLPPVRSVSTTDCDGIPRFSRVESLGVRRVFDSAGPQGTCVIAPRVIVFRTRERRPLPDLRISELNASPTYTPIQRFECGLTTALAWLWAGLVRCSLPV